jgi:predicted nucleic-acid-binding protein
MTRYVDTNILVRIMTNDVPELTKEAIAQVERSRPNELLILDAVLVELFFVLEAGARYHFPRTRSALIFNGILDTPQFKVSEMARAAFVLFTQHPKLDFMDCLLAAASNGQEASLMTFDKDLLKILA